MSRCRIRATPGLRCAPASATSTAGASDGARPEIRPEIRPCGGGCRDPPGGGGNTARASGGMAVVVWGAGFRRFPRLAFLLRPGRPRSGRTPRATSPAIFAIIGERTHPGDAAPAGGSARRGDPRSVAGEGNGLSPPAAGDPAARRRLLRRLPAHGLGDAGAGLHAQAPGRRIGQAALVGRAPGGGGRGAGEARRALRADLSRPHRLRRLPGIRPAAARLRDSVTASTCSRCR